MLAAGPSCNARASSAPLASSQWRIQKFLKGGDFFFPLFFLSFFLIFSSPK